MNKLYNGIYMKEKFAYLYDSLIKWIQLKQLGSSIGDRLKKKNVNIIAIYGANEFGQMVYKDVCNSVEVICYIDKKAKEMKTDAFDKGVIGLDELSGLPDKCYILVTPEYHFREIADDLITLGIGENYIISFSMVVA